MYNFCDRCRSALLVICPQIQQRAIGMAELNRVLQLAVRELLIAAYNNSPKKWSDFARDLAELDIEQMARLREANTPRERPKLKISEEFALKLVAYCKTVNGFTVSDGLKTRLGP